MNLTVYVKKELAEQVNKLSKTLNKSRNSIINEALELWLKQHGPREWPAHFFEFEPVSDIPDFTSLRESLIEPDEDPLQ